MTDRSVTPLDLRQTFRAGLAPAISVVMVGLGVNDRQARRVVKLFEAALSRYRGRTLPRLGRAREIQISRELFELITSAYEVYLQGQHRTLESAITSVFTSDESPAVDLDRVHGLLLELTASVSALGETVRTVEAEQRAARKEVESISRRIGNLHAVPGAPGSVAQATAQVQREVVEVGERLGRLQDDLGSVRSLSVPAGVKPSVVEGLISLHTGLRMIGRAVVRIEEHTVPAQEEVAEAAADDDA